MKLDCPIKTEIPPCLVRPGQGSALFTASSYLRDLLQAGYDPRRPLVVLCIGTDRATGDSLGPLVGTFLSDLGPTGLQVKGSLDQPVHALNLAEVIEGLREVGGDPFIIAIDSSLGRKDSIGLVKIARGALHPGTGVNKTLPPVGDINITGIVNIQGFMEVLTLQSTRLSLVMSLSRLISRALFLSLSRANLFYI